MGFVWSSSVSTNLLAITCQVYTLLPSLLAHPHWLCVCVDKRRNLVWLVTKVRGDQFDEQEEKENKGEKVHHLWLVDEGWREISIHSMNSSLIVAILWLCVCGGDSFGWSWHNSFSIKKWREWEGGRNSTWRRFFVDQCLIFLSFSTLLHLSIHR